VATETVLLKFPECSAHLHRFSFLPTSIQFASVLCLVYLNHVQEQCRNLSGKFTVILMITPTISNIPKHCRWASSCYYCAVYSWNTVVFHT